MVGSGWPMGERPRGRGGNFRQLRQSREDVNRVGEITSIPDSEFLAAVSLALTCSCGVLLSPTSDGGAVSVIVYDGDERYRTYCSTREEFQSALEALRDLAEAKMMGSTPTATNGAVRASQRKQT